MFMPSLSIVVAAVAVTAILLVADWFVWGMTYSTDFRLPRRIRPLGTVEIIDRALGRLIAANQAILPKAVIESAQVKAPMAPEESEGAGFRKVA
jgi:hypothetical protein